MGNQLLLVFKDTDAVVNLKKDYYGKKEWKESDLKRMFRKKRYTGYDLNADFSYTLIDKDCIAVAYILEDAEEEAEVGEANIEMNRKDVMYG